MENKVSESSIQLKAMIEKVIEDEKITREEYDKIIYIATKDGVIDRHEKALLNELQQMIENKAVEFVMK